MSRAENVEDSVLDDLQPERRPIVVDGDHRHRFHPDGIGVAANAIAVDVGFDLGLTSATFSSSGLHGQWRSIPAPNRAAWPDLRAPRPGRDNRASGHTACYRPPRSGHGWRRPL